MPQHDWYRNTTWTSKVKENFLKRLERSRTSYNKAQYVRIQASYLQKAGKKANIFAAIELLDLMIRKWPEPSELPAAHLQRAQCFESLQDVDSAIKAFRESITAECQEGSIRCQAALHFGWFVVEKKQTNLYDEVLAYLQLKEEELLFSSDQFKFAFILAIIYEHKKEPAVAKRFARMALEALVKTDKTDTLGKQRGFLSLINSPEKSVVKTLETIARR